jgi:hypothetical protein
MKLVKPSHPDPTGTGLCYSTLAAHRKTSIDLVIAALRRLPGDPSDQFLHEVGEAMREWTIEAVIQGAWVREYHKWETDTKSYFGVMHARNGGSAPKWGKIDGSHVEKVKKQLAIFSAAAPASMAVIEDTRCRVNGMKHEDSYLASQSDYETLAAAVDQFWQDLNDQEEFCP